VQHDAETRRRENNRGQHDRGPQQIEAERRSAPPRRTLRARTERSSAGACCIARFSSRLGRPVRRWCSRSPCSANKAPHRPRERQRSKANWPGVPLAEKSGRRISVAGFSATRGAGRHRAWAGRTTRTGPATCTVASPRRPGRSVHHQPQLDPVAARDFLDGDDRH